MSLNIRGPVASGAVLAGEFTGKNLELQGVYPTEPSSISLGTVVKNAFALLASLAYGCVDMLNRRVYVDDSDDRITAVKALGFHKMVLEPVPGQEGRSLGYRVKGSPTLTSDEGKTEIEGLIAPAPPTFTVESLLSNIASVLPEDGLNVVVSVDQAAKEITIFKAGTQTLPETCSNATHDGDDHVGIELEAIPATPGNTGLPFEGGAV